MQINKSKKKSIIKSAVLIAGIVLLIFLIRLLYQSNLNSEITPQSLHLTSGELKGLETISENKFRSVESDSWIEFVNVNSDINNVKLILDYEEDGGVLQIFFKSKGQEYSEQNSQITRLSIGKNEINLELRKYDISSIRIDFTNQTGITFQVEKILLNDDINSKNNYQKLAMQHFIVFLALFLVYLAFYHLDLLIRYRYLIGLLIFAILVLLKLHGSSIGMWNSYLGQPNSDNLIMGKERAIRSDEWLVQTPYLLSQNLTAEPLEYSNHLIRSDGQNMVIANAPTLTFETLGKPFYWGFLFLNKDYAISWFYFSKLILLILLSYEISMILTNRNTKISLLGALWISFSAPIQWWYTTGAGVVELIIYSQGIIVSIYYLLQQSKIRNRILLSVLTLLSTIGFVFTIYPALQVPLGFLVISFVIGLLLNQGIKNIAFTKLEWFIYIGYIFIISILVVNFLKNSLIDIQLVLNTVYPGDRVVSGGQMKFSDLQLYLVSFLLPFKDINYMNNSESSSFVNFLPIVVFGIITAFSKINENKRIVIPIIIYLLFQLSWLFIPYPEWVGKLTLFSFVPEIRLAGITFGLTALYLTLWFISETVKVRPFSNNKVLVCIIVMLFFLIISVSDPNIKEYLGWLSLPVVAVFLLISFFILRGMTKSIIVSLALLVVCSGVIVNPIVQGTGAIYDRDISEKIQKINESDPDAKWITLDNPLLGQYLLALGSKTFNSVHFYPDLNMWRKIDRIGKYEEIYNRYAHVNIHLTTESSSFELTSPDSFTANININDLPLTKAKYILTKTSLDIKNIVAIDYDNASGLFIYQIEREGK